MFPEAVMFIGPDDDKLGKVKRCPDKFMGPEADKFMGPIEDKFMGPEADKFMDPEADKFMDPIEDKFMGPEADKFMGPIEDKFMDPEAVIKTFTPLRLILFFKEVKLIEPEAVSLIDPLYD